MARVKAGPAHRTRRKKTLKRAKGYRGFRSRAYRKAAEAVTNALKDAFKHRRKRKSDMRSLWVTRINAAVRAEGISYGMFINALKKAGVAVNRKALATLAVEEPPAFKKFVELAKQHLSGAVAA